MLLPANALNLNRSEPQPRDGGAPNPPARLEILAIMRNYPEDDIDDTIQPRDGG